MTDVAIVGTGVVGAWVLRAIERHGPQLREREGIDLRVVAVANRGGLLHVPAGLELERVLAGGDLRAALDAEPGDRWPTALEGLDAVDPDVLVEVGQSPPGDGEPGLSHLRQALSRGIPAVTSNKWPVAHAGVELVELAARSQTWLSAESTVMSGTPVLRALTGGLGCARPLRVTGIVNATVNAICTRMADEVTLREAIDEAQAAGLAEADPSADLDGLDSTAKLMVLAALVFGVPLDAGDVRCGGLSTLADEDFAQARRRGESIREVIEFDPAAGRATVTMRAVAADDPLAAVRGTANLVRLETDVMEPITIGGPGAGPHLAGQGAFADLVATARRLRPGRR